MTCPSESELVEFVERIAPADRHGAIDRHIDTCSECRVLVAELARSDTSAASEPALRPVTAAPEDVVPAALIRDYVRADALHRESIVARALVVVSAFSFLALLIYTPFHDTPLMAPTLVLQTTILVYGLAVIFALRRGWFHPALPFVASIVEVSLFFAVQLVVVASLGQPAALGSPGAPLAAAAVVFSAIRADPRICLVAGVTAMIDFIIVHYAIERLTPDLGNDGAPPGIAFFAGAFFLLPGLAGAALARYLVARAEGALRAIRERDLFGKYLLHESLGTGGMGEVFRATYCPEGGFTKTVAVKRVRAEIADDARRIDAFREEARIAAQLAHPNLVQVLDFGRFHGSYMVAMEYVDGVSLATLLRRCGALDPAVVAYLGAELAAGLDHMHARLGRDGEPLGLVHCDVNPPNVLLSRIGEVKLADFGVVRGAARHAAGARTFSGKAPYAAPEQLRGEPLDGRTDLFALGLTLMEATSGRRVFAGEHEHARSGTADPVARCGPQVPAPLAELLHALVRREPDARLPTAARLRAELLAQGEPLSPYPRGAALLGAAVIAAQGDAKSQGRSRQPDRDDRTPSSPSSPTHR